MFSHNRFFISFCGLKKDYSLRKCKIAQRKIFVVIHKQKILSL